MKKLLYTSLFVIGLSVATQAPVSSYAADSSKSINQSSNLNYAVINVGYIMSKSKAVDSISKQIENYKNKLARQAKLKQEELQQKQQKLAQQQNNMSPKEFEKARNDFQQNVQSAQQDFYNKSQELDKVRAEALSQVEKTMSTIVSSIAKDKKYELIFASSTLAIYPKDQDISEEVSTKLNKKLSSVNVKKPF